MVGYYDYHPTHQLYKPLTLVSFVNAVTRKVAHHLSSVTGLTAIHLDDLVQHELGASTQQIITDSGLKDWRDAENLALGRAVSSSPPSIISLGEGAIDRYDDLNLVLDWTNLIYLYLPLEEAIGLAARQNAVHGATLWAEVQARGGQWAESIRFFYDERCFNYRMAHHTIDYSNWSSKEVVDQILAMIPNLDEELVLKS